MNTNTGKVLLEVDHIDGNCLNNRPKNLRLICPNCHSLTSTYKGANKNSGRTKRLTALKALVAKPQYCKLKSPAQVLGGGSI